MAEDTKVLVVDDDVAIRKLARILLTRSSFTVEEARNGHEAIRALTARRYDAIVLDLMMPGSSGLEVISFLENNGAHGRCVIVMSAASDRHLACVNSPLVHSVVRKPFDNDVLIETVRECVSAGRLIDCQPPR